MTRTDVHRPSFADPADYTEVGSMDLHPEDGGCWLDAEASTKSEFVGNFVDRGRCDHCGAGPLRYVVVFLHGPSDRLVFVGERCATLLSLSSKTERERKREREHNLRVAKRDAWLESDPRHKRVYDFLFAALEDGNYGYGGFYHSLMHKLNRYGELTDNQVAAALKAADRDEHRAAERAAEPQPTTALVTGRREVVGVVLGTKNQDGYFRGEDTVKMLVQQDDLNKVWGTVPQALFDAVYELHKDDENFDGTQKLLRGKRVRFTATVDRSSDDEHFGFFKRPTKAEVVT